MNNINMGVKPVSDTQISDSLSKKTQTKNSGKEAKVSLNKEPSEVSVNKMAQRLNSSDDTSVKDVLESKDTQSVAAQVSNGQAKLADAQSGHITMEFVQSLLNKSPYEQRAGS